MSDGRSSLREKEKSGRGHFGCYRRGGMSADAAASSPSSLLLHKYFSCPVLYITALICRIHRWSEKLFFLGNISLIASSSPHTRAEQFNSLIDGLYNYQLSKVCILFDSIYIILRIYFSFLYYIVMSSICVNHVESYIYTTLCVMIYYVCGWRGGGYCVMLQPMDDGSFDAASLLLCEFFIFFFRTDGWMDGWHLTASASTANSSQCFWLLLRKPCAISHFWLTSEYSNWLSRNNQNHKRASNHHNCSCSCSCNIILCLLTFEQFGYFHLWNFPFWFIL